MNSTTPPQLSNDEQQQRASQLSSEQQQDNTREKISYDQVNERNDRLNDLTSPAGTALSILNFRKIRAVDKEIKAKQKEVKKATDVRDKLTRKLFLKKIRIFFEALSGIGIVAAIAELTSMVVQSEEINNAVNKELKLIGERNKLNVKKYNLENLFKRYGDY